MRAILLTLCLLAGCATASSDAPRAEFEPRPMPDNALDHDVGNAVGTTASAAVMQVKDGKTCVGSCPDAAAPCHGTCKAGEYCDQSSGIDRCMKDVVPAATTPGH